MKPLLASLATLAAVAAVGVVVALIEQREATPPPDTLHWETDFDVALSRAQTEDKLLLMHVYADWCGACRQMQSVSYTNPAVLERLGAFVLLKVDSDLDTEIAGRYGTHFLPTTVILDADAMVTWKGAGYYGPEDFLAILEEARAHGKAPQP